MPEATLENYLAWIRNPPEGSIVYGRPEYAPFGPQDGDAHLSKDDSTDFSMNFLEKRNTGRPDPIALLVYTYSLRNHPTSTPFAVLDLGPGAGQEPYQLHIAAAGHKVVPMIDTVAKTPINPLYAIEKDAREIYRDIKELCDELRYSCASQKKVQQITTFIANLDENWLPMEALFKAQKMGAEIFTLLDKPFVNLQYIIDFNSPKERSMIIGPYKFIYEALGAFFFCNDQARAAATIFKLLSDQGIYYSTTLRDQFIIKIGTKINEHIVELPDDFIAVCESMFYVNQSPGFVCRRESQVGRAISQTPEAHMRRDNIVKVRNLERFVRDTLK